MAESASRRESWGDTSPEVDLEPQTFAVGAWRRNVVPGTSLLGWRCGSLLPNLGHPGTWEEVHGQIGGPVTLRAAYLNGSLALHQTLPLSDADGGGLIIDGSGVGFTSALSLRINSAAAGPFVVDRANGYVGIGQATPLSPLHISVSDGSANAIRLDQSAHQRIEKRGGNGLSIVVPGTANPAVNWLDLVMGSTSKIKIEPGSDGGPKGVITFNNSGGYAGTLAHFAHGETIITQSVVNGSNASLLTLIGGAHVNLTAGEMTDILFNLARTVQQTGGNHATNRAVSILAPTYSATSATVVTDAATVYIDGAPPAGTNMTLTRAEALWIGAGNGGGIRTDGFGATGLIKNNNGGLWTLGVAGTDYVAPWSLTLNSIVVSGGGSLLVEDNAYFYYLPARHRAHSLGQTVIGPSSFALNAPQNPELTGNLEAFDVTETTGAMRDSGLFWIYDNMYSFSAGGFPVVTINSNGLIAQALQTRYLYGGTEDGRDDASPLVIYGGSAAELLGLQLRATSTYRATSGTQRAVFLNYLGPAGGFAPTSGTAGMRYLDLEYEINQTGGANGAVYGVYVSATRTAEVGTHYGLRIGDTVTSSLRAPPGAVSGSTIIEIGESGTGIGGFSGILAYTNARSAQWYVDNSIGNVWISNRVIYGPNGSAAGPMYSFSNSADTGAYLYTTGELGFSAAGRHSARVESDASSRYFVIGEAATGIAGWAMLSFETNARAGSIYLDNAVGNLLIATPQFAVAGLVAGGMVKANVTTGQLALASAADISTALGLTGPAVVFTSALGVLTVDTTNFVYNDTNNRLSVGASSTTARLFAAAQTGATAMLAGGAANDTGSAAIALVAGNSTIGQLSNQIVFGFDGTEAYRHVIRSRHDGATTASNALDFFVWTPAIAPSAFATVHNLSLAGGQVLVPFATAAAPGMSFIGDADTGLWRYTTDTLGVATGGRHTARFESDASSRFLHLGEAGTGIAGYAYLGFFTNARSGAWYLDNAVGNVLICTTGIKVGNDTAIGLYRVGAGVMALEGTSIDIPSLSASGYVFASITTGRLVIGTTPSVSAGYGGIVIGGTAPTQSISNGSASHLCQFGAVFSPLTSFPGNPHWIGDGKDDIRVGASIRKMVHVPAAVSVYTHFVVAVFINANSLDGDFEIHFLVDGVDQGVYATVTAGGTGGATGTVSYSQNVVDESLIEMKLVDSPTGSNVTSGSLDIRATCWGVP